MVDGLEECQWPLELGAYVHPTLDCVCLELYHLSVLRASSGGGTEYWILFPLFSLLQRDRCAVPSLQLYQEGITCYWS